MKLRLRGSGRPVTARPLGLRRLRRYSSRLAAPTTGRIALAGYLAGPAVLLAHAFWSRPFELGSVMLYTAAVVVAGRLGGLPCGLFATAVGLGGMAWFELPPPGLGVEALEDKLRLLRFAGLGGLISYLSGRLHLELRGEREGEDYLRHFTQAVRDYGIMSLDPEGRVSAWNEGQERLTGYAAAEILDQPFERLFPPEERDRGTPQRLLREAREKGSVELEGRRLLKDGRQPWCYTLVSPSESGYTVVTQDMTRQRRQEERFRLAIESAPSGMVLVDEQGAIVLVNKQAELLFGYGREELLGRRVELLLPERLRLSHTVYRERYQAQPSARQMGQGRELLARRKDGTEFPVEIGLNPFRSEEGRFVLAAVVDVTERKKSEERLRKANEALERRVADLEEFSYTISHDLRAPLRSIEGFSRILLKRTEGKLGAEERALLDRIARAVNGMDRLIEDVLAFGRATRKPIEMTNVDLNFLVEDVLARYPASAASIRVIGPLAPVRGNEGLVTQILANLLSNAVKFVPPERRPEVEVSTRKRDGWVRLMVKDNGIGIPAAFRERIFRPFERIPGPIAHEGTGMGLAIVRKAAERLGGRVGVESEPGAWSLFWVDLPEAPP